MSQPPYQPYPGEPGPEGGYQPPAAPGLRKARHEATPQFWSLAALQVLPSLPPHSVEMRGPLPRGCLRDLEALLKEHGVTLSVDDQRIDGEASAVFEQPRECGRIHRFA